LVTPKAPGPSPSFSVIHVIKALELVAENSIGRKELAKKLLLGEGATRTLIERLRTFGLISVERGGCVLSEKGQKTWRFIQDSIPQKIAIEKTGLELATYNVALIVRRYGRRVRSGIEQRDAAMLVGAKGATTLKFEKGEVTMPPDGRKVQEDYPELYRKIWDSLSLEEGDAIIIGSADVPELAEYGALAAAWSIIK
jgi:hypothetical protein